MLRVSSGSRSAPLCQEAAVLAVDSGVFDEVMVESGAGVEDLDAYEAAIFPVQRDKPFGAGRGAGLGRGAAW